MTLETQRLHLRKFVPADLERFAQLAADPGFMRFSGRPTFARAEAGALLDRILHAERDNCDGFPSL